MKGRNGDFRWMKLFLKDADWELENGDRKRARHAEKSECYRLWWKHKDIRLGKAKA